MTIYVLSYKWKFDPQSLSLHAFKINYNAYIL